MFEILYVAAFLGLIGMLIYVNRRSDEHLDGIIEKLKTIDRDAYDYVRTRHRRGISGNKAFRNILAKYRVELQPEMRSFLKCNNAMDYLGLVLMIAFAGLVLVLY